MDRVRRIPMEGWVPRFMAETDLDRVSRLSIAVEGSPKNLHDNLGSDILARKADMEMFMFTVMNGGPGVLQQICSS